MKEIENFGAMIDSGAMDWQIFQQDKDGFCEIRLKGRWKFNGKDCAVETRLVDQNTGAPPSRNTDWKQAVTNSNGSWHGIITKIPAGGLYRIETRLTHEGQPDKEWSIRGDMIHNIGVGDLWVIAGQSNAVGYGREAVNDPPELGVHLLRNSEKWTLATHPLNDSTDTRHPLNCDIPNPGHSFCLSFAKILKRNLGYPIGLIQTALGGSPLARWNPLEEGDLYKNMLHCIELAGGKIKGILWYQGCSDTDDKGSANYGSRFKNMILRWRKDLKDDGIPILTVQLNRVYGIKDKAVDRGWSKVREAQRQAALKLKNVFITPAIDLSLSDTVHISSAGNMILGERMARVALGGVYKKPIQFKAPDIAKSSGCNGGKTVRLILDNVVGRLCNQDSNSPCFKVEDEKGAVDITQVEYKGSEVYLKLLRRLEGSAVIHGAYGANPPMVPLDIDRMIPMLAFYNIKIG
ncbi:MAG: sialate O-acetylesterase [candidate division WOR-3 bacterium]|nr:sialate O-acetylesterase [candidate division WOR-3 bacterium]